MPGDFAGARFWGRVDAMLAEHCTSKGLSSDFPAAAAISFAVVNI